MCTFESRLFGHVQRIVLWAFVFVVYIVCKPTNIKGMCPCVFGFDILSIDASSRRDVVRIFEQSEKCLLLYLRILLLALPQNFD